MVARIRSLFSLSIIVRAYFVKNSCCHCYCYCSRLRHLRWQHLRRGSSSISSARSIPVIISDLYTATNVILSSSAHENHEPTSTTAADYATVQLLSTKERQQIDQLVQKRSISRWNGEYDAADEIRCSIDDIRIFIPLSRILQEVEDQNQLESFSNIMMHHEGEVVGIEYKVMVTDIPRTGGGGSYWELIPIHNEQLNDIIDHDNKNDNILQLAHAALGMTVSASERGVEVDKATMNNLICRTMDRLQALKQRKALSAFLPGASAASTAGELHGRKAADAILWFALAGYYTSRDHENSVGAELYNDLVHIVTEELQRFGMNSSCRAKDVLHIVERVAMAGIRGAATHRLYRVAAECLDVKLEKYATFSDSDVRDQVSTNTDTDADVILNADEKDGSIDYDGIIRSLRDSSFGLHSDRSLLGLWRFSTRQRKQRAFFKNAARHFDGNYQVDELTLDDTLVSKQYDWSTMFKDPSRPLVVDVGCGMGVSLLGLASTQRIYDRDEMHIDWSKCNFIGVDLSQLAIGYANSVCARWGMSDILNFIVDSAENCLVKITASYPGRVELIMLQFPTPYRFPSITNDYVEDSSSNIATSIGYNTQLPEGSESDDFMVTEKLLAQIHAILTKQEGRLLIQSNCEDVAVHMRSSSTKVGFQSITVSNPVTSLACVTQRARRWTEIGGERAIGRVWSQQPLLPVGGRTETEVACILDGKPVHRCLLRATTTNKLLSKP